MPHPTVEQIAKKPRCPRCGRLVKPTTNTDPYNDYTWECPDCDEDFFNFEVDYPDPKK